ncbi:alpha/beta hydrolase [Gryllotalpicola ginsengisoli]|uniref:alpha/beta hydrolase n=1 Tax=Gryllotalpicola ginsengisoli TaxID=444608 RepID=UPI0003B7943C|nr:alpha/beta hydrolase [Gryllotalpicola ginsengisoli]
MSKEQREAVNALMRTAAVTLAADTIEERRARFEARALPEDTAGLAAVETTLGARPALEITGEGAPVGTVLYFHGGGYVVGSHRTGAALAAQFVRRAGMRAYSLDYRLAPEHRFPAAALDGLAAYRELLERGVDPARIVLAGDSAGGHLAVTALMLARDAGLPMPAAAVAFSPLSDQRTTGSSFDSKAELDPLFSRADIEWFSEQQLGDGSRDLPLASPGRLGELRGLPPFLIQVGSYEVLLSDAVGLAGRLAEADVDVTLEVTAGVPHVFQGLYERLDEAEAALESAMRFVAARLGAMAPVG